MRWFTYRRRNALTVYIIISSIIFASQSLKVSAQHQTETDLLLAVVINGRPINEIGDFKQRDGKLYATPTELDSLGLRMPANLLSKPTGIDLSLSDLKGVTYRLDEKTQTIYLTTSNGALKATVISGQSGNVAHNLPVESGLGAATNYNIVASYTQGGRPVTQGLFDTRLFSPWGVILSTGIGTSGAVASIPPFIRLDTTYSYSDAASMRHYRVGDFINGGLAWTRPVRLGGVQITTDFSIRPDLVTVPVPTLSGNVAVPSSVDVLVNGVQLLSRDVPPGPFEVSQLPVVTGSGDVSVVIHNAVGADTTQTLPIYTSNLMLARGLSAFSAELGAIRFSYGVASEDYRAPAASFSFRRGVFNWLTLEAHGEGSGSGTTYNGLKSMPGGMAGAGAAFTLGPLGVVSFAAAGSKFAAHSGHLVSASFERDASVLSFAASVQAASSSYGDIAASSGQPVPAVQMRGSVGLSLGDFGSLGIAFVGLRGQGVASAQEATATDQQYSAIGYGFNTLSLLPPTNISLVSLSYSRPIFGRRAFLYSTAFHDFSNTSSSGVLVGVSIPIGRRISAGASFNGGGGDTQGTFQASQPAVEVGDVGWQVQDTAGTAPRQIATGEYKSPWGEADLGIDRTGGQSTYRATVQGAVAYAGGGLFASNTIADSFAVVNTESPGIHVLQENRLVGTTGPSGLLLVPDLRSYDANRLGIDPTDVPVDSEIGLTARMVRPQDHSGVIVRFPVKSSHGALVKLVDASGTSIPVGSIAQLTRSVKSASVIVGYDGDVFLTGLRPHNALLVKLPNGHTCNATFNYKPVRGTLPQINDVKCLENAS